MSVVKMLGSMICPAGLNKAALEWMQTQGQEWVNRITTPSCCNIWFMVDMQFWPRLSYGICNTTASWEELEHCLKRVYWQLLPKGGVRLSAPALLRQMDRGFYKLAISIPVLSVWKPKSLNSQSILDADRVLV
jgi:hypothetical protein